MLYFHVFYTFSNLVPAAAAAAADEELRLLIDRLLLEAGKNVFAVSGTDFSSP